MRYALALLGLCASACAPPENALPTDHTSTTESSSNSLVDDQGNAWTLTSDGQVQENGVDVPGGGGSSAITYIDGVIYVQDAKSGQWYAWINNAWVAASLPSQPAQPAQPAPMPVVLTTSSGGAIHDASGDTWTLTSDGRIQENGNDVPGGGGTSALTYVDGVIYGQDAASGGWYTWTNGAWDGPVASPLNTASARGA